LGLLLYVPGKRAQKKPVTAKGRHWLKMRELGTYHLTRNPLAQNSFRASELPSFRASELPSWQTAAEAHTDDM